MPIPAPCRRRRLSRRIAGTGKRPVIAAQLDFLHKHGCDIIQGYLLAKPLSAREFEALLKERKEPSAR